MRRIPSTFQSLTRVPRSQPQPFICRACTQRAASTSAAVSTYKPAMAAPVRRSKSPATTGWKGPRQKWMNTGKIEPPNDALYVPAERGEGLEVVGTPEWVQDFWSKDMKYFGFMSRNKAETEPEIREAMIQAVERATGKSDAFVASAGDQIQALHDIDLSAPMIKFEVVKDFMRYSGIRVSDNIITHSHTAGALYHKILTRPKQEKVFEKITKGDQGDKRIKRDQGAQLKVSLRALPNVTVFKTKRHVNEKEREVGRLKVITRELKERNLA